MKRIVIILIAITICTVPPRQAAAGNPFNEPWQNISTENTFSNPVSVREYFNFSLKGTWSATVYVQRSFDNGVTWQDVGSYTENVELTGFEPESGVRYRFGVKTGDYSSGTVMGRISQ